MERGLCIKKGIIKYIEVGNGSPFVILHGWGDSHNNFMKFQETMAGYGYRVFFLCLPGFDKDCPLDGVWSTKDYVKWLNDFVKKARIKKFFLYGHSFGSLIALSYAATYPKKISRLIIAGPPKNGEKFPPIIIVIVLGELFLSFLMAISKILPRTARSSIERQYKIYQSSKGRAFKTAKTMFSEDINPYLDSINRAKIPTLIIYGEKDNGFVRRRAIKLHKIIFQSVLKVFLGRNHFIHEICPDELAAEIEKFVKMPKA